MPPSKRLMKPRFSNSSNRSVILIRFRPNAAASALFDVARPSIRRDVQEGLWLLGYINNTMTSCRDALLLSIARRCLAHCRKAAAPRAAQQRSCCPAGPRQRQATFLRINKASASWVLGTSGEADGRPCAHGNCKWPHRPCQTIYVAVDGLRAARNLPGVPTFQALLLKRKKKGNVERSRAAQQVARSSIFFDG